MSASANNLSRRISQRDRCILDHVARYRLTTHQVLGRLFFPETTRNSLTKVTARLCREGRLAKFPLRHPRAYFTLGEAEARDRGLPPNRCQPLGPQSLPMQYAVLAYATMGTSPRLGLTAKELHALCPWLPSQLLHTPHCIDEGARPPLLECLRVDLGGTPDHMARKCETTLIARQGLPEFDRLLSRGAFRLVVLTATREKAAAIKAALNGHLWPDGLKVHLAVIPDLQQLIAS